MVQNLLDLGWFLYLIYNNVQNLLELRLFDAIWGLLLDGFVADGQNQGGSQ